MEDERAGGASVTEAAQKLKLAVTTVDAVDRSGRQPNGQPVASIPQGLNVVTQAFNSDVGVDNDPISFQGGYVWYDVLGVTPSHDRKLDEVKDQVEAKWREDQIDERLKAKGSEIVKKLEAGGKLADAAAAAGVPVETAANFKREDTPAGVPPTVVSATFKTPKDGAGQTAGGVNQWIVFRVTNITVPPTDFASDDIKKLRDSLQRALEDEQITEYVSKLETNIGTSINESAFAQVTGENNN